MKYASYNETKNAQNENFTAQPSLYLDTFYLDTLMRRVCRLKWAKGQVKSIAIYGKTSYFYSQIPSFLGALCSTESRQMENAQI
jgi:hypothetical protein